MTSALESTFTLGRNTLDQPCEAWSCGLKAVRMHREANLLSSLANGLSGKQCSAAD